MTEFFNQLFCEFNENYSVIIEDDGRVAYAYLLKGKQIIGDVWLYNQAPAPCNYHWDKKDRPFLNPKEYIKTEINPILHHSEVGIKWLKSENLTIEGVFVYIKNELVAKMNIGSTPGWSTLVAKEGPLAKVMSKG